MPRSVVAVPEQTFRLHVNGRPLAAWTCSPGDLHTLAAGRLLASGFVHTRDDILALETLDGRAPDGGSQAGDGPAREPRSPGIDARLEPAAAADGFAEREHRAEHGCGARFLLNCRPDLVQGMADRAAPPPPDVFPDLFRALYDTATAYRTTGGLHTAALSDGAALRYHREEVGRHNAVDRVIGSALLDGMPLTQLGLVTTARISGDIAEKAARAGLAWIASRSVPTTLAVAIAGAAGIPIIARAPSPDARTFDPDDA